MRPRAFTRGCLWSVALSVLSASCESETGGASKAQVHGDDCNTCHVDDAMRADSPPHLEAMFNDCEGCHSQEKWSPAMFVHTDKFPLSAGHADVSCKSCHTQGYTPGMIPDKCVDCHGKEAAGVANPIHAGLSTDCFACHRIDGFKPAHFVHSWPLQGAHETAQCVACHKGKPATYEGTDTACLRCHVADRDRADATVSGHAMYETACENCHGVESF